MCNTVVSDSNLHIKRIELLDLLLWDVEVAVFTLVASPTHLVDGIREILISETSEVLK